MHWPTFLIIGAPRAGTTALYAALRQHPQIAMSRLKEPNFFAYGELTPLPFQGPATTAMAARIVATPTAYQTLFTPMPGEGAIGEASMTNFLPRACARIHHYLPTAKLIAILRHPAERAYSQFVNARRIGWEPLADFGAALASEARRQQQQWIPSLCYKYRGYYAARLAPYFTVFPRTQLRVYRYETWRATPQAVLQDIFEFIGVDPTFTPQINPRLNAGQLPRWPGLLKLLRYLNRGQGWQRTLIQSVTRHVLAPPPPLGLALRHQLMLDYRADILELQNLLEQDFSDWLASP